MFSKLRKIKKNWFTMLELIFTCVVFAMLISGIILAINRTYIFMNNTRVEIRATNLTREWMEMMFNIRDTNWRKCAWEKDKFWLYLGSGSTKEGNCDPEGKLFQKWVYAIKEWIKEGDRFVYAEKLDINELDIGKFYSLDDDGFFKEDDGKFDKARSGAMLTFTWTYNYWSWSAASGDMFTWEMSDLLSNGVEFYRIARVYGIYEKNVDNSSTECNVGTCAIGPTPKEMRFCVKTFYKMGVGLHASELCSIMTNFEE